MSHLPHPQIVTKLGAAYTGFHNEAWVQQERFEVWRGEGTEDLARSQWAQAKLAHSPGSPPESGNTDYL